MSQQEHDRNNRLREIMESLQNRGGDETTDELLAFVGHSLRAVRSEIERVHVVETVLKIDLERVHRSTELATLHLRQIETDLALLLQLLRDRHSKQLHVFFLNSEGGITMQIASNSAGLALVLAESLKGNLLPLSAGPFLVELDDPNNTVSQVPGSPDQTTPDLFEPNGTGNTGTVNVKVTDQGQTPPLVGTGSFDVIAPVTPPPPTTPDTLTVGFAPITPATSAAVKARSAAKKV